MSDNWDECVRQIESAAAEGRHQDAFLLMRRQMIAQAFAWFDDAGIRFVRVGPQAPLEFQIGLAMAARKAVEPFGENVPPKLEAAAMAFEAVANLDCVMRLPETDDAEAPNRLAQLLMHAGALGSTLTLVAMARLGHFEKLLELELDRERRRAGAHAANRKRATAKEKAAAAALAVLGVNPTLSADEAAPRIREKADIATSLRTIADWVRAWRRSGDLPKSDRHSERSAPTDP